MKTFVRVALILAVSSCCNAGKKSPPSGETTVASSTPASGPVAPAAVKRDFKDRPEKTADVKDILEAYKNNEVRADGEYKGKRVQIKGKVGDVKKDITDDIYVTVGTGADFEIPVVQCFVKDGEEKAASALNKGDDVTVMGHVDGLMMNVLVKDCVINPNIRLCEKLQAAIGSGTCEGAVLSYSEKPEIGIGINCIPDVDREKMKKIYDIMLERQKKEKWTTVGSDTSYCFAMIMLGPGAKMPPDLVDRTKQAVDKL